MQRKSQVGGILAIISGIAGMIESLVNVAILMFVEYASTASGHSTRGDERVPIGALLFFGFAAVVIFILAVAAIAGGVCAIRKQRWGVALGGAICGILTFLPTGIVATVLVSQTRGEFSGPTPTAVDETEAPRNA
jgi:hypothetical protein